MWRKNEIQIQIQESFSVFFFWLDFAILSVSISLFQLAKAGPASRRQLGEHTSMSTPSKAASEQRFAPAKNYSRANHKAQSNLTFPDDGYSK